MRLIMTIILLAFPFAEIFLLVELAHRYGWWLLVYLVVIGFLGLQLIRGEKLLIGPRLMQSLSAGGSPIKAMLGSARNMAAGVLLMIPGVMTDMIALLLLLVPVAKPNLNQPDFGQPNPSTATHPRGRGAQTANQAANDDVIEGEFVEIKEETEKK